MIIITGIRLFLISLYTFLLSLVAFVLLLDRTYTTYFILSRIYGGGVLIISGMKLTVSGKENVDKSKAYVYVANHSSMYDIPALQKSVPTNLRMVFKKEIAKIPFFGWQLAAGPYIVVDRNNPTKAMQSIEEAKNAMIEYKDSILLFAEGTRSETGEVQEFKRGAFNLAVKVQHEIIPVSICNTQKIMPKGSFNIRPGTIHVHYDKPIPVEGTLIKKDELELMAKVRKIIIENKEKYSEK